MKKAKIQTEVTVCDWCIKTVESRDDLCDDCQDKMWAGFMKALATYQDEHNTWVTTER